MPINPADEARELVDRIRDELSKRTVGYVAVEDGIDADVHPAQLLRDRDHASTGGLTMACTPPPPPLDKAELLRRYRAGARTIEELDPELCAWCERDRRFHIGFVLLWAGMIWLAKGA